jgi:hypothetical protein
MVKHEVAQLVIARISSDAILYVLAAQRADIPFRPIFVFLERSNHGFIL